MAPGVIFCFLVADRATIFGYEPFPTPTVSMSPTVEKNEFFMTDTWRYHSHPPEFGEIVVFKGLDGPGIQYIRRIVGLPGDRIEVRDSVLYRNGHAVWEPHVHPIDDARA